MLARAPPDGPLFLSAGEVGSHNSIALIVFCLHLENAKVYGKGKFPYSEAAYYSSKLWHTQSEGKVVAHSAFQQSIIG